MPKHMVSREKHINRAPPIYEQSIVLAFHVQIPTGLSQPPLSTDVKEEIPKVESQG